MMSHYDVFNLASLIMLTYEYGKILKLNKDIDFRTFFSKNYIDKYLECNIYRSSAIKNFEKERPFGRYHKYHLSYETGLHVVIFVNEYKKKIYVVFKGTDHDIDWYYNLQFFQIKLNNKNVFVHQGFYKKLHNDGMYEKILKEIEFLLLQYSSFEIVITGHSLGAALATLFSFEISSKIPNSIKVVTFASPRVGNFEFKNEFDNTKNLVHYRITNDKDLVTAIPFFTYHHVGINIALSEDKVDIFKQYTYDLCLKFSIFNCHSLCDHDMDNYFKRIIDNEW